MTRFCSWREARQHRRLWPAACGLALVWLVALEPGPLGSEAQAQDPLTVLKARGELPKLARDVLPLPPEPAASVLPWLLRDLSEAPEVHFQRTEPIADQLLTKDFARLSPAEQAKVSKLREDAAAQIIAMMGKINRVNQTGVDHFMKVLIDSRGDFAGLPWAMGDDCRLKKERSTAFVREVSLLRSAMSVAGKGAVVPAGSETRIDTVPWDRYDTLLEKVKTSAAFKALKEEDLTEARVAAHMQILGPASAEVRRSLAKRLADVKHAGASQALARLAVFSVEPEVRQAALDGLRERKRQEYAEILLQGLRYPWPAFADNAGQALIALGAEDLLQEVIAVLDEPDPRAPVARAGKAPTVREVVKINHHHNCLLCHAPANADDPREPLSGSTVVIGEVPNRTQPLPSQSRGYKGSKGPNQLAVRVDVTYLRQDFSMLLPVKDAAPWPELQRFDFLVREREVGDKEVQAYEEWLARRNPGSVSPNQRAAIVALRALTGRDAAPTSAAWRRVLGL